MDCYRDIHSAANTLKIITICSGLKKDYGSTYYNDKYDVFIQILGNIPIYFLTTLNILH